jgi:hypothetical protein
MKSYLSILSLSCWAAGVLLRKSSPIPIASRVFAALSCANYKILDLIVRSGFRTFNIRFETLKLVQERIGNTLELIGIGNNFLNRTQTNQQLQERIDKWDCMKIKCCCIIKEMVTRLKRQPTEWETIFGRYISD